MSNNPHAKRVFGDIDFGTGIRILRIARGMTSKHLSEKSGISQAGLARIENGSVSSNPTIKTLKKLALGLDVDVNKMITIQDDILKLLDQ